MRNRINLILILILCCNWINLCAAQDNGKNPHGAIKWDCQNCHTPESWKKLKKPLEFNHENTGFALEGLHKSVDCRSCHTSLKFIEVETACVDCHTDVHRGQLGIDCQQCHNPETGWKNQKDVYEMHSERGFPLVGVHAAVDCNACHLYEQQYEFHGIPIDCNGCHISEYQSSQNPNHMAAGFGIDCETCHLPIHKSWEEAIYPHTESFVLRGAHRLVDCMACHQTTFAGTPSECYSCHSTDYQESKDPSHIIFGFPTDCNVCHIEDRWEGARFDHIEASGFELQGVHAFVKCTDCHVNNQLSGLPRDCFGCHETDFRNVSDPNHVGGGFPQDCIMCHTQNSWQPATFDHNLTQFPLTGAHVTLECLDCHSAGFAGTPTDCYSCHEQDFVAVSDPSHVTNNFSHDCMECHSTAGWSPATFDHNQTQFPLTGAHLQLQCIDCHSNGYVKTPIDCYSCHEQDFVAVSDPNHVTNNFSHDCMECHSTAGWSPATFDHNQTQFPLTGSHVMLPCISCHEQGYAGTPTDCYSCHEQNYISATNPNHQGAGFPIDCESCHNTIVWTQTTFDHDNQYFPIYSGAHQGEWNVCTDCHVNQNNYAIFECVFCHEHRQSEMDDKHREVQNYVYLSTECYNCHPDGRH